jgi:hypothetical protein
MFYTFFYFKYGLSKKISLFCYMFMLKYLKMDFFNSLKKINKKIVIIIMTPMTFSIFFFFQFCNVLQDHPQ